MNKSCARPECGKTVYPMEELKCLDKVWHKQCFKCGSCQMTLNMKNYKGYNRVPYCEAHCPKPTASVIADTPEMKRLAENTQNQSLIRYHEDFEKMKGKKIEIADDPEMSRLLKNTQVASQAAYHHEGERKEAMERVRPPHEQPNAAPSAPIASYDQNNHQPRLQQLSNGVPSPRTPNGRPGGSAVPPHLQPQMGGQGSSPYSAKMQTASTLIYSSEQGGQVSPPVRPVGSIHDYDPLNGHWGSAARPTAAQKFSQKQPPVQQPYQTAQAQQQQPGKQAQQQHQQRVQPVMPTQQQQQRAGPPQQQRAGPQQQQRAGPPQKQQTSPGRVPSGSTFKALYDYTAADTDEVSFLEGDLVVNCQSVDSGWMTGTVSRTGKFGMLPANYVQRV